MRPPDGSVDLRAEVESALRDHVVACWFPRSLPTEGAGFHQDFDAEWRPGVATRPSLVFQARMTWVTATLARRAPAAVSGFDAAAAASSGLAGFRARFGRPGGGLAFWDDDADRTHAYAIAFAIFSAAAVHRLSGDDASRGCALGWLAWLDFWGWDEEAGLYHENLALAPKTPASGPLGPDIMGTPRGAVSSNAVIHLIEALTELVTATRVPVASERLARLVSRVEEWVTRDDGRLWEHYSMAGHPLSRTVSWGHDLEAYHVVHRARVALGITGPTPLVRLAERALEEGLDRRHGGVFLERRAGWRLRGRTTDKVWWVQAEAANALALLHRLHGEETDRFYLALRNVWGFVRRHQLDDRHGGWIDRVSRGGGHRRISAKAHAWKACYHETRALLDIRDDLEGCPTPV